MQHWNNDYGHDQFSAHYGDPYIDENEFKYNTSPSETIQLSTPLTGNLLRRDASQQADNLACQQNLLQIRDSMFDKFKKLLDKKEKFNPSPAKKKSVELFLIIIIIILVCIIFQLNAFNNTILQANYELLKMIIDTSRDVSRDATSQEI